MKLAEQEEEGEMKKWRRKNVGETEKKWVSQKRKSHVPTFKLEMVWKCLRHVD
jgi:hypothetical protein